MIKYKTNKWLDDIEEIHISRQTYNSVFFLSHMRGEVRYAKKSVDFQFHDTKKQAKEYLIERGQKKLEDLQNQWRIANLELEQIQAIAT